MTTTGPPGFAPSGPPVPMKDILLAMREAQTQEPDPNNPPDPEASGVRFELPDYPHDLVNGSTNPDMECTNAADPWCVFDPARAVCD